MKDELWLARTRRKAPALHPRHIRVEGFDDEVEDLRRQWDQWRYGSHNAGDVGLPNGA